MVCIQTTALYQVLRPDSEVYSFHSGNWLMLLFLGRFPSKSFQVVWIFVKVMLQAHQVNIFHSWQSHLHQWSYFLQVLQENWYVFVRSGKAFGLILCQMYFDPNLHQCVRSCHFTNLRLRLAMCFFYCQTRDLVRPVGLGLQSSQKALIKGCPTLLQ